jgi:HSP20 family molecular chaperone IbpA
MVARALDLALDAADLKQRVKRDAVIVARGRRSRTSVSQGNDYLFIERVARKIHRVAKFPSTLRSKGLPASRTRHTSDRTLTGPRT